MLIPFDFQEESKALTIKEKLKRKMQQQLKKTFKVSDTHLLIGQPWVRILQIVIMGYSQEDKKAEKERLKKMEEEEKMRDEELKEMSDKMRER